MKRRWMHLIAGLTMFALCISVCTTTANAAEVWKDNFDDGNLDGWTIFGYENFTPGVEIGGNFSAADYTLKVLDDDFNVARHNSNVSVGTWSFDIFVPDDGYGFFGVNFMDNGSHFSEHGNLSILAIDVSFDESKFILMEGFESRWYRLRSHTPDVFQGWHHIDVSKTSDCHFLVRFNGSVRMDIIHSRINSSTYLSVVGNNATGAAIDNLVVDDDPDKITPTTTTTTTTTTPTTTPTTPPPFDPLLIGLFGGIGVGVVVIVLATVYIRRR